MKTSDITMLSVAILIIAIGIMELNNMYNAVFLLCTALLIIMYVIITVWSKKRLERKIEFNKGRFNIANRERIEWINKYSELEKDFANQVNATDECERLLVNQAEKNTLEKAGQVKINVPPHTIEEYVPFTEDIKQCPDCKDDMRETKCYWICDNCKKRIRKEK